MGTSPWIWFALHGARFLRMFSKIAVWTQSATDDPEFVSPSTGHQILHQCRVRFSKFAYVDVCVWGGKCLLTSCERIIQKKTLNPFVLTQSGWMFYYNKITVKEHFVQQVNCMTD